MFERRPSRLVLTVSCLVLSSWGAGRAQAQAVIKVNDDVSLRFGALVQMQGDWQEDPATGNVAQNYFIRRIRGIFGGTITKQISFFIDTDNPNLGQGGGRDEDHLVGADPAGRVRRLQADAQRRPVRRADHHPAVPQLRAERHEPVRARLQPVLVPAERAQHVGDRPRHRVHGAGSTGSSSASRCGRASSRACGPTTRPTPRASPARAQYSFGDPDVVQMFYAGTNFGAKKTIVLGGGVDHQNDYTAYAADFTVDRQARLGRGQLPGGPHPLRRRHVVQDAARADRPAGRGRLPLPAVEVHAVRAGGHAALRRRHAVGQRPDAHAGGALATS